MPDSLSKSRHKRLKFSHPKKIYGADENNGSGLDFSPDLSKISGCLNWFLPLM
jgi:hypothetical protein